jgi:hypothetical protein
LEYVFNIFYRAVIKFDEVKQKLEEKDNLIQELGVRIEIMNSLRENSLKSTNNKSIDILNDYY